jgi:hypothetical protein
MAIRSRDRLAVGEERMAYDHLYSVSEVARILDDSEQHGGHSISLHTKEIKKQETFWTRRGKKGRVPNKDSIFTISRTAMVAIVREVLNSPSGQAELRKLNDPNLKKPVKITSVVLRDGADFDIFTVYRPTLPQKESAPIQTYFDWLSTTQGDGFIVQVKMYVSRAEYTAGEQIHIHTTFPEKYARTQGDMIVGNRP